MNNNDYIHRSLGKLEAKADIAEARDAEIFKALQEMNEKLAVLPKLIADVEGMQTPVANYKRDRNRAIGFVLGASMISGVVGSQVIKTMQSFFNGN